MRGTATGALDPDHPANTGIADIDRAPTDASGLVGYRADVCIMRPADPAAGNGRLLYEVANRGRPLLFGHLCGGTARGVDDIGQMTHLGDALPLRRGFTVVWSGWDPDDRRATGGMTLDAPVATEAGVAVTGAVRDEFVSGTRMGTLEQFRLSYPAATDAGSGPGSRCAVAGVIRPSRCPAAGGSWSTGAPSGCCRRGPGPSPAPSTPWSTRVPMLPCRASASRPPAT